MNQTRTKGRLALAVMLLLLTGAVHVFTSGPNAWAQAGPSAANFNTTGELIRPEGYREWIYVGAPSPQRHERWQGTVSRVSLGLYRS